VHAALGVSASERLCERTPLRASVSASERLGKQAPQTGRAFSERTPARRALAEAHTLSRRFMGGTVIASLERSALIHRRCFDVGENSSNLIS